MANFDPESPGESGVPLDKLTIEAEKGGKKLTVPALSIGFAAKRTFIKYEPPPIWQSSGVSEVSISIKQDLWTERTELFIKDMEYLLNLSHHRFWCQVVFDEGLHGALDSYLRFAPRHFDFTANAFTSDMKQLQDEAHRKVFLVFIRMGTYKESKTNHITPAAFGDLIYNNFIFDVPKLMDICVLFQPSNKEIVQKLVNNVFKNQPQYYEDFASAVPELEKAFTVLEQKLSPPQQQSSGDQPNKLTERRPSAAAEIATMPWSEVLDLTLYFVDTCATISAFLDMFPEACHTLLETRFALRIPTFYAKVVHGLTAELSRRKRIPELKVAVEEVRKRLSFSRKCLISAFRLIVTRCCVQPILETIDKADNGCESSTEEYLHLMQSILYEKRFLIDYLPLHPLDDDFDLFAQMHISIDPSQITYIRDTTELMLKEAGKLSSRETGAGQIQSAQGSQIASVTAAAGSDGGLPEVNGYGHLEGACAVPLLTGVELDSAVSQVKDLLPHLGDGFVEACLEYFKYEAEKVINAILTDMLPKPLRAINQDLPKQAKPVAVIPPSSSSLLLERKNVFDNDEFDFVRTDQVDMSKIHKGKRSSNKMESVASDKDLKEATLNALQEYESVGEKTDDTYDDEYDDTYDEQLADDLGPQTWDEMLERRPFVKPRVLQTSADNDQEEESSEDEGKAAEVEKPKRDEFCANPEVEREKAALRRQSTMGTNARQREYKGQPKGQGQDAQVLKDRAGKERRKASHGNHNRRSQADWKRSKGMIPT